MFAIVVKQVININISATPIITSAVQKKKQIVQTTKKRQRKEPSRKLLVK